MSELVDIEIDVDEEMMKNILEILINTRIINKDHIRDVLVEHDLSSVESLKELIGELVLTDIVTEACIQAIEKEKLEKEDG